MFFDQHAELDLLMPEAPVGCIPCRRSALVEVHVDEEHTVFPGTDVAFFCTPNPGSAHAGGPTDLVRTRVVPKVYGGERSPDRKVRRKLGGGAVEDLRGASPEGRCERVHLEPRLVEARFDLGHGCPPRFRRREGSRTARPAFGEEAV